MIQPCLSSSKKQHNHLVATTNENEGKNYFSTKTPKQVTEYILYNMNTLNWHRVGIQNIFPSH